MSASRSEADGGEDEVRFRRSGAAALAAVLREKQDAPPQAPSVEETYRSLCYDDPIVSAAGCQALAQALGQQVPRKFALSNRLVHGVQHVCHRMTPSSSTTSAPPAPPASETDEVPASLLDPTTTGDASSAYASLAWVVYGQVPLRILLSDNLTEATSYLGSFRGSVVRTEELAIDETNENRPINDNPVQEDTPVASPSEDGPASTIANNMANEPDEVWAAESDPSDFDFGTEPTQEDRLAELEVWTSLLTVEPIHLSQSPVDTTWSDVAHAVSDLLPQLAYNRLAGLSLASWKQWRLSESLTQLTLTLMLPGTLPTALVGSSFSDNHWQQLALQPLHTFRDAVEVHSEALLEDFLQLIALLLQANHHAAPVAPPTASPSTTVAPTTLVGLGTLAHLCTGILEEAKSVPRQKRLTAVRDVIVRSADDLTAVLEQANGPSEASNMFSWTFLSLWRVVSTHEPSHLSKGQAQILLQSGILRQWMLVWQKEQQAASPSLRAEIERSLFYLCCAAPGLLGKYAWRFADFAAHVTAGDDTSREDALLVWNLVGAHLAEQVGETTVVWKAKGAPVLRPTPKASACQEQAIVALRILCSKLATALESWKERRIHCQSNGVEEDSGDNIPEETLHAFEGFDNLLDAWSIPLVQTLFLKLQAPSADESLLVENMIRPIKSLLASWPSHKSHEETKDSKDSDDNAVAAKPDKPSDEEEPPKRRRGRVEVEDGLVVSLRKSIKVLQSILETGQANEGPARFSSKAD
jgi:hypothetical protein